MLSEGFSTPPSTGGGRAALFAEMLAEQMSTSWLGGRNRRAAPVRSIDDRSVKRLDYSGAAMSEPLKRVIDAATADPGRRPDRFPAAMAADLARARTPGARAW